MNRLYLLVTNFVNSNYDYTRFYDMLKSFGPWWHYLKTGWIVRSQRDLTEMVTALHPLTGEGDHFMMVEISHMPRNGWLPTVAWQWLDQNDADQATGNVNACTSNDAH